MMDSQSPNDLCRQLKHQTGRQMLGGSIYLLFIKPYPVRRATKFGDITQSSVDFSHCVWSDAKVFEG